MWRATPAISADLGSSIEDHRGTEGWLLTDSSSLEKEFISSSNASRDTSTVSVVEFPSASRVLVRSWRASRVPFLELILFHRDLEAKPQINLFKVVLKSTAALYVVPLQLQFSIYGITTLPHIIQHPHWGLGSITYSVQLTALSLLLLFILYTTTTTPSLTIRGDTITLTHDTLDTILSEESPDILPSLPSSFLPSHRSFCWNTTSDHISCLPAVYLAGMPKCGSTDLFQKIAWHREIIGPKCGKENHYWTRSRLGRSTNHLISGKTTKKREFSSFLQSLGTVDKDQFLIDGTQSLFWDLTGWEERYPNTTTPPYTNAQLVHRLTPGAKIIIIIRDPVSRIFSDYLYFTSSYGLHVNRSAETFDMEVREEVGRFRECLDQGNTLQSCCYSSDNDPKMRINLGVYVCFVKDWLEYFPTQLLPVSLEDYSANQQGNLNRIYRFLDVTLPDQAKLAAYLSQARNANKRPVSERNKGDMWPETELFLREFYQLYNSELARLVQDTRFLYPNTVKKRKG
eukprot:sb/3463921/